MTNEQAALRWLYIECAGTQKPPKGKNHWGHIHERDLESGPTEQITPKQEWKNLLDELKNEDVVRHGRDYRWDVHISKVWGLFSTEKEYSGRIMLRIPKELHKKIAIEAKKEGVSMNQFIVYKLAGSMAGNRKGIGGENDK